MHVAAGFPGHRGPYIFTLSRYCEITLWGGCVHSHAHQQGLTVSPYPVLLDFKVFANLTGRKGYLVDVFSCLITSEVTVFSHIYWPLFYFLLRVVGQCSSNCHRLMPVTGIGGTSTLAVLAPSSPVYTLDPWISSLSCTSCVSGVRENSIRQVN